jgi:hypothetical protein
MMKWGSRAEEYTSTHAGTFVRFGLPAGSLPRVQTKIVHPRSWAEIINYLNLEDKFSLPPHISLRAALAKFQSTHTDLCDFKSEYSTAES